MAYQLIPSQPFCISGESVRNYCEGVYFHVDSGQKKCGSHSK